MKRMDEHRFPDVEPNCQGFPRLADLISTADDPGSANGHRDSTESGLKINDKNRQLIREVSAETGIVFRSDRMRDLIEESIAYAQSSASVLVTGESGTGKELFARLIHSHSQRSQHRFVQVNCAALSENVLESEFFGHAKGAFTGADQPRVGRFEWADGGTLLLDEVSEIPVRLQAKLLRVLEEGVFQRVGCNLDREVDVRVIATSNRNLQESVREGSFRDDLYHRLNILQVDIPPLRQRMSDVDLLCQAFVDAFQDQAGPQIRSISKSAMRRLKNFSWPGNVRQLRNVICRACILADEETLQERHIRLDAKPVETLPERLLNMTMAEIEKLMILTSLQRFDGNKTQTASHLGITSRTLHNKLKLYQEAA